jgi:hypothetical protein
VSTTWPTPVDVDVDVEEVRVVLLVDDVVLEVEVDVCVPVLVDDVVVVVLVVGVEVDELVGGSGRLALALLSDLAPAMTIALTAASAATPRMEPTMISGLSRCGSGPGAGGV